MKAKFPPDTDQRFICDVMLGRLAKWLRLLGYDTLYDSNSSDNDLLKEALLGKRVLLTRDRDLSLRKGPATLHITADRLQDQLRQVISEMKLCDRSGLFHRCSFCNTTLRACSRDEVEGKVPEYVHRNHRAFTACPDCNRIYWSGTHRKHVLLSLARVMHERPR